MIVFDKDGVLIDLGSWMPLMVGIADYLVERASALGDRTLKRDDLLRAVGVEMRPGSDEGRIIENSIFASGTFVAMRETWQKMAPSLAPVFEDLETYRRDVQRIRLESIKGNTVAKGEVAETLSKLKKAGWALAIGTNDTENSTRMNLEDIGVADAFDAVICCDSGFGRKPEPDGLLEACRITGHPPERSIMVGDTQADWLAAQNAGFVGFVAIAECAPDLPGFIPSADSVLPDISGMVDLLAGS